jgi:hypothetical protein
MAEEAKRVKKAAVEEAKRVKNAVIAEPKGGEAEAEAELFPGLGDRGPGVQ